MFGAGKIAINFKVKGTKCAKPMQCSTFQIVDHVSNVTMPKKQTILTILIKVHAVFFIRNKAKIKLVFVSYFFANLNGFCFLVMRR